MGLYTIFNNIENYVIFKFIVIIIIGYIVFRNKKIGLNVLLGIVCAIIVILYIYDKNKVLLETVNEEYIKKLDSIEPTLKTLSTKNRDLIDFLFSIQDFYGYNPQTFEEMIDNINALLKLQEMMNKSADDCEKRFQIAFDKKNNAINCLNSVIYSIPASGAFTDKLIRSHKRLETLLNKEINKMYDLCYQNLAINGHNINTSVINTGPNPANMYLDKDFTFQLY